jgi:hypothetical protein
MSVREETILGWARRLTTPEEAYQTEEKRGIGRAWRIRLDALHQMARERGVLRWRPGPAAPRHVNALRLLDVVERQQEEIARLQEELRAQADTGAAFR